jgi:hypothetical protein
VDTARLLSLENNVLDAMIRVRYALEDPTQEVPPGLLDRIRRMADMFASTAERLQAQRDKEYADGL